MKKKLLAIILSAVMIINSFSMITFADEIENEYAEIIVQEDETNLFDETETSLLWID